MNGSAHAALGALIGTRSRKPWMVVFLSVTSHFMLDYICHDPFLNWLLVPPRFPLTTLAIAADIAAFIVAVGVALRKFPKSKRMIVIGVIAAVIPDTVFYSYLWEPYVEHSLIAKAIILIHYTPHNRFGLQGIYGAAFNVVVCMAAPVVWMLYLGRRNKKGC